MIVIYTKWYIFEVVYMKNFQILFTDIKGFMGNEVNRLFILILIVNLILFGILNYQIYNVNKSVQHECNLLKVQIYNTEKKVDFRYFNITRSLEDIYNLKINTLNGEIKKRY